MSKFFQRSISIPANTMNVHATENNPQVSVPVVAGLKEAMEQAAAKANASSTESQMVDCLRFLSLLGHLIHPSQSVLSSMAVTQENLMSAPPTSHKTALGVLLSTNSGQGFASFLWILVGIFGADEHGFKHTAEALNELIETVNIGLAENVSHLTRESDLRLICEALAVFLPPNDPLRSYDRLVHGISTWLLSRFWEVLGQWHKVDVEIGEPPINKTNNLRALSPAKRPSVCLPSARMLVRHVHAFSVQYLCGNKPTRKTQMLCIGMPGMAFLVAYACLFLGLPVAIHTGNDNHYSSMAQYLPPELERAREMKIRSSGIFDSIGCSNHLKAAVLFFPGFFGEAQLRNQTNLSYGGKIEMQTVLELHDCCHDDEGLVHHVIVCDLESDDGLKERAKWLMGQATGKNVEKEINF